METRTASSAAVSEVLNVNNYLVWSVQVRTYLIAQDLWDIVEATDEYPKQEDDEAVSKAWSKKNAMALHVIQISCPQRICHVISLITSAKIAWETLESICSIPKSDYFEEKVESYVDWSNRTKTFLMNHDLWNIVETTTEPTTPAWSKKNALALYFIRESYGSDGFDLVENISKAKDTWDTFAEESKSSAYPDSGMENDENGRFSQYVSLEKHIRKGDWDAANQVISSNPEVATAKISITGSTALHIAIFEGHMNIVEKLVNKMSEEELKIKDTNDYTVLGYCAIVGNIQMAKCIIGKSRTLLSIGNESDDLIPVVLAVTKNQIEMARYLYPETPLEDLIPRNGINGASFITRAINSKAIDMALDLLEHYPELAIAPDYYGRSPVEVLAGMSFAYQSGNRLVYWKQWIYNSICIPLAHDTNQIPISIQKSEMEKCGQVRNIGLAQGSVWNLLKFLEIDQIYDLKLLHHQSKKLLLRMCEVLPGLNIHQLRKGKVIEAMMKAVKQGRVEFVTEILKTCPDLIDRNLFKLAVLHRQHEVFRFLCKSPAKNALFALVDSDRNTILHISAMFEPSARRNTVPGAAFLMQREVQWYKEVESIVHPFMLEYTNKNGQRPRELFTESHKELMKEGEKWMKETASSCTVVAALIVTIMFAAAITVPGGNIQDSGLPTFLNEKVFMVFIISDALSLLSASTSLLMFLGILTSRYAEEDFLKSLPKKMIVGLSTLILSIATMMITFCASLFIILPGKSRVVIPIICLAIVPVTLFAWMQFHLLIDMVISTYASRILDKKATYGS
ncbi:uncharacterized protein LOC142615207 [Castanea sativa]|uniref:uncharacterized protein LOC142615207 n=1 Tax=Castanea sativa TaxID=21020 RepID=UPI003F64FEE9